MSGYALTSLAKADIFEIWSFIPADNEEAVVLVERAIYEGRAFVAEGSERGHPRTRLTGGSLRFWTLTSYPNYGIVHWPEAIPIQIVAVPHGKRNI